MTVWGWASDADDVTSGLHQHSETWKRVPPTEMVLVEHGGGWIKHWDHPDRVYPNQICRTPRAWRRCRCGYYQIAWVYSKA